MLSQVSECRRRGVRLFGFSSSPSVNRGKMRRKLFAGLGTVLAALLLVGCSSDADVVSENISKDAEQFKVERRITFINGITDKHLFVIEGKCSTESDGAKLRVTCKVADGNGSDAYKRHELGLSDNVTYSVQQVEAIAEDPYHYKFIFKPETVIPDINRP